jgi:hypothetical protein
MCAKGQKLSSSIAKLKSLVHSAAGLAAAALPRQKCCMKGEANSEVQAQKKSGVRREPVRA